MFYFWITLLLCMSFFINIYVVSAEIFQPRFCEPIRIELCKGIGYNETSFPNLIGHELQTDAEFTLQTFSPLIQYGCSTQLKFFLCSTYTPMCTTKVQDPIGPCRSLCESVRAKCHPVLEGFGFNWPTTLDCSRFPSQNNHEHMCMEGDKTTSDNISNKRNNDKSIKIKSSHSNLCEGFYKSHLYVKLNRSGGCVPFCDADILFDPQEKNMAEIWLISWSISALFLAVVATLCLILTSIKCDKILMPLVICHCFVTIGWLIRWLAGRNSTACGYDHQIPGTSLLLTHDVTVSTTICIVCFMLRYYFGMASGIWWTIFCYQWNVSLNNLLEGESTTKVARTTSRSKENNSSMVHNKMLYVTAWGIPALQTLVVLFTRYVDADELIGSCFVGNHSGKALLIFVIVPLLLFWVIGSVYLISAYFKRKKAQKLHLYNLPVHLNGIGTFLFIYAIPFILLIALDFLVYFKRDNWVSSYQLTSEFRTPLWSFVALAVIELLIGVLASSWSIGPRIISLCKCRKNTESKSRMNKQPVQKVMPPTYAPCPYQNSFASISRPSNRRYLSQPHINRKSHAFKTSLQTVNLTNHETIL